MEFQIYINGVLFYTETNCDKAFALFNDWRAKGANVKMSFVRTQPLAA